MGPKGTRQDLGGWLALASSGINSSTIAVVGYQQGRREMCVKGKNKKRK